MSQAQTRETDEKAGSRILTIDGRQYGAFPVEKLREFARDKIDLQLARVEIDALRKERDNLNQIIANQQEQLAAANRIEALQQRQLNVSDQMLVAVMKMQANSEETIAKLNLALKEQGELIKQLSAPPSFWSSWKGKLTLALLQGGITFGANKVSR